MGMVSLFYQRVDLSRSTRVWRDKQYDWSYNFHNTYFTSTEIANLEDFSSEQSVVKYCGEKNSI
jgi:hypothetical protein